jgi:hypothetical protein
MDIKNILYIDHHRNCGVLLITRRNGNVIESIFDVEDLEKISIYQWSISAQGYIRSRCYSTKGKSDTRFSIWLHRYLISCPEDKIVDHINRDKLDNRKLNIRICDQKNNLHNRRSFGKNSKYKGVYYCLKRRLYKVTITMESKNIKRWKYFKNEIDAARQYNLWAIELQGEFAYLNRHDNGDII